MIPRDFLFVCFNNKVDYRALLTKRGRPGEKHLAEKAYESNNPVLDKNN